MLKLFNIKSVTGDAALIFISSLLASAFTFSLHMLMAKKLDVHSYGVVNVLLESGSLVVMMADMGLTVAFINLYARYKRECRLNDIAILDSIVALLRIVIGGISAILVVIYFAKSREYHQAVYLSVVVSLCACIEALNQHYFSYLQCVQQHKKLAMLRIGLPLLRLSLIGAFAFINVLSVKMAVIVYGLSAVVFYLATRPNFITYKNIRLTACRVVLKDIISVATWTSSSSIIVILIMKLDIFLLATFASPAEIAIYAVAQKYASVATIVSSALATVLMPKAASIENKDQLKKYLKSSMRISVLFAIPIIVLGVGADLFLPILFGAHYDKAAVISMLLIFSYLFGVFVNPLSYVFYNLGLSKMLTRVNFIQLVIAILVGALYVHTYGAIAVAISNIVTRMLGAALIACIFIRQLRVNFWK